MCICGIIKLMEVEVMNKQVTLKNGSVVPQIGLGTWMIGDNPAKEKSEINAILTGIKQS